MPNTTLNNLKEFAQSKGIALAPQKEIAEEASTTVAGKYNYNPEQIKENFDQLLQETEKEAYRIYLEREKLYGAKVIKAFFNQLRETGEITDINQAGDVLGGYFNLLDKFFLSMAQSRKARAGKSFEDIHNSLFKQLSYCFDEQKVINGKPDFLMPSLEHYQRNSMDCIIFTSKRTLRERWRQIVTEGTRGLGFFLATIDEAVSQNQLNEMKNNRIYLVCPKDVKERRYPSAINVLSFTQFFKDNLDPAMERWKRNGVIQQS